MKKLKIKNYKDFSKEEQQNINHNRGSLDNKDIVKLILELYKRFFPLLLIFIGFILLAAYLFYRYY